MRFPQRLNSKLISEWKEAYIAYELLKTHLSPFKIAKKACAEAKEKYLTDIYTSGKLGEELGILQDFELKLNELLLSEREKVLLFLTFKMQEVASDYELMKLNIAMLEKLGLEDLKRPEAVAVRAAILEFYKKIDKLSQFIKLNEEGFLRIINKHYHHTIPFAELLELFQTDEGEFMAKTNFKGHYETLNSIRENVEECFIKLFYTRFNRDEGTKELKHAADPKVISKKDTPRLFFFMGCTFTLFIVLIIMWISGLVSSDKDNSFSDIFQMFRGSLLIILYFWLLSWNVFWWTSNHINYKRMFKFNQHHSTLNQIFKRAAFFLAIWLLMFLWYIVSKENFSNFGSIIPKDYTPLIVYCTIFAYFIFPSKKYFNGQGRLYMYRLAGRMLCFACYPVDFPIAWAADQMVSFVIPLQDLQFTICFYAVKWGGGDNNDVCHDKFYAVGFLAAFIPYSLRMIQIFRIMKSKNSYCGMEVIFISVYFLNFVVVLVSSLTGRIDSVELKYLWIALAICATTISYFLDLKFDWMFFEKGSKLRLLREKRIFKDPRVYYLAMVANLVLRCSWVFSISPAISKAFSSNEIFIFLMALLEVFRRSIWNIFRVEKEHIVTCSEQLHTKEPCGFPYSNFTLMESGQEEDSPGEGNNFLESSTLSLIREGNKLRLIKKEEGDRKIEVVVENDPVLNELNSSRILEKNNNILHTKNNKEIRERFLSVTSILNRRTEIKKVVKNFEKKIKNTLGLSGRVTGNINRNSDNNSEGDL